MNSFDFSDILGGGTLPAGRYQPPSLWSSMPDFAKTSLYAVCGLVSVLVFRDIYSRFLNWRERRYRKATRRRHGIPDSDQRPFNVAYAAAVNARREREVQSKDNVGITPAGNQQHLTAQVDSRRDRNENLSSGLDPILGLSANSRSGNSSYDIPPIVIPSPFVQGNSNIGCSEGPVATDAAAFHANNHSPQKSNKTHAPTIRPSKRALHGDEETEFERDTNKRSRLEDEEELVDHVMEDVEEEIPWPKRGSKRMANPDEDITAEVRSNRGAKRARKISRDHVPQELLDDPMEDTDVLSDTIPSPRGKKRDRVEEESIFGEDDDDANLDDPEDRHRRRRKRRTVSNKKNPRGQKRSREVQALESDSEADLDQSSRRSRKKRGKRTAGSDNDDVSMDSAPVSDSLYKGRAIGEEWEVGSTRYRVGPNGERLQQTLVKQWRPKYTMPADSEHPDKDVTVEVIVESWLTDEQYQAAKEHFDLAWQDSPKVKTGSQINTSGDIHTPAKGRKNLLWSSSTSHPESPIADRRPFRQSIVTNVGLHLDPFQQSQYTGKRRITGAVPSPIAGSPDKPNLKQAKSYSKWEKQDLEAETMSKIKQRLQEQKKTAEVQNKPAVPQTSIAPQTTPASNSASISLFPPSNDKPVVGKDGTSTVLTPGTPTVKKLFSFAPPPAKTDSGTAPALSFSKGPSTPSGPLGIAAPSVPNFFSNRVANDPPASKPAPTSGPSFKFSSSAINAPPAHPSFNFSATSTHPQSTSTVQEQKKVEKSSNASTAVPSSTPLFSFAPPKNTPVPETKQPQFSFGVTNKPNTSSPLVSNEPAASFGNTQQPQQTISSAQSSPFAFPSQPPPSTKPKLSFGTTSFAKGSGDAANAVESSVGKPFGETSHAFASSSTPSSQSAGSSATEAKPSEVPKPPIFSFGITPTTTFSNPSGKLFDTTGFSTTPASSPAQPSAFNLGQQSMNKQPFSFGSSSGNTSEAVSKQPFGFETYSNAASSDTSKNTVGFGTSTTPTTAAGQQSNIFGAAKPAVPSFSFAPASTGAASTPAAFGFGNSDPTKFTFGKPEEKK